MKFWIKQLPEIGHSISKKTNLNVYSTNESFNIVIMYQLSHDQSSLWVKVSAFDVMLS